MYPVLLHIYGPFNINSYGVLIAIGIIAFIYLVTIHPARRSIISFNQLTTIVYLSTIVGFIGAKLLDILTNWGSYQTVGQMLAFWNGGASSLGAFLAILAVMPFYTYKQGIPVLQLAGLTAIYAPLTQAIGRIGCFLAGCCYGAETTSWLAVTYTNPESMAPLAVPLHPTQLYSALILLIIFGILKLLDYKDQQQLKNPQIFVGVYLLLSSLERFAIDFLRNDREFIPGHFFSVHQELALVLFAGAFLFLIAVNFFNLNTNKRVALHDR